MNLTIHRGANEIGGSCVELSTGSTRILLDLGMPLKGIAPELSDSIKTVDAVVISHPHEDHFGLIEKLPKAVPVYIGNLGLGIMQASRLFRRKPPFENNFRIYGTRKKFTIGDFTIRSYLMDHSAVDSYALEIEADGKKVFYSGDFRGHGRKRILFDKFLEHPVKGVDLMLMEGTMLGRTGESGCRDEDEVEARMLAAMKREKGLSFLMCSSQNIDRLVSAYRACKQAGRIFVTDIYTAWILRLLKDTIRSKTMDIRWDDVMVLSKGSTASRHYRVVKENRDYFKDFAREIYSQGTVLSESDLKKEPRRYMLKTSYVSSLIEKLQFESATVMYSMWGGYLTEKHNPKHFMEYDALRQKLGGKFMEIHCSGHGYVEDLQEMARAVNPKVLVPIHTENADEYVNHYKNVKKIQDAENYNF